MIDGIWSKEHLIEERKRIMTPEHVIDAPRNKWTRKMILSCPSKHPFDNHGVYDAILLFPTGKRHESGYAGMAGIGLVRDAKLYGEVFADGSDVIDWIVGHDGEHIFEVGRYIGVPRMVWTGQNLRMDCIYPSGMMQFWRDGSFFVIDSCVTSTCNILVIHNDGEYNHNGR